MSSEPAGETSAQEVSAGGVVVRDGEVAVIVPTRRAADGSRVLALPKGHVDPGETRLQAAEREVREETGVDAVPVRELGEARYCYRRHGRTIGKSVTWFLFCYRGVDIADNDEGGEEDRCMGLEAAKQECRHAAAHEMVGRVRGRL